MSPDLIPLDYATLRLLWWIIMGVLLVGFGVLGGADLGVGALLPFVARHDAERRVAINSIGPTWEGNQVWFILGGGAVFAAWPTVYAAAFSVFYSVMLVLLLALILRPVGFDYRNKLRNGRWRATWDWCLVIAGVLPAFLFGAAMGNLLQGVPIRFDDTMRLAYEGSVLGLLNPFALLCGLVSLAMLVMHGAMFLVMKTDGPVRERARTAVRWASCVLIMLFGFGGVCVLFWIKGYVITGTIDPNGASNPLAKTVTRSLGAWYTNYADHGWLLVAPALGLGGAALGFVLATFRQGMIGFWFTGLSVAGVIGTAGISMFPFILPSRAHPGSSLTVWDASSSPLTLFMMLAAVVLFLPLVLLYTGWVLRIMRGKVDEKYVRENTEALY
jgi:cytochrome bd ubiquinol oxidase subunit II